MKTLKALTCLLILFLTVYKSLISQNIIYQSSGNNDVILNDGIYLNNKFYMVGNVNVNGINYPKFVKISENGQLEIDTNLIQTEGYFSNIILIGKQFHISSTFKSFSNTTECNDFVVDTLFQIKNFSYIDDGFIDKSKLISDSLIAYIGHNYDTIINMYTNFVVIQNLTNSSIIGDYQYLSQNPIKSYDIIKNKLGYSYFVNSPDSFLSNSVFQFNVDSNLNVLDRFSLKSSYSQYNANQAILGPITAESLSDSTFLLNSSISHPQYANQQLDIDIGVSRYNIDGTEISLSFTGKIDTNSLTTVNSITKAGNYYYIAATENSTKINSSKSNIVVSKVNTQGNIIWSQYYSNSSANLKFKKIVSFKSDSLLIIGTTKQANSAELAFAIKTDTSSYGISNSIRELTLNYGIKLYPNPTVESFLISFTNANKVNKITDISIYDINGKEVKKITSNFNKRIYVSNLKSGIYFVNVSLDNEIKSFKLIKL